MKQTSIIRWTVALSALLLLSAGPAGAASSHGVARKGAQALAELNHTAEVFAEPGRHAKVAGSVNGVRPITRETTVLPVLAHATTAHPNIAWLEVRLPGRPNSHTGWIHASATTATLTAWKVDVSLSARRLVVLKYGRRVHTFEAVVGKPSTPTPTGQFFVEESIKMSATTPGAPYALALSARSNVFSQFDGGPGQIALHGVGNLVGVPGTAASHGCVRLSTPNITWLVHHIGPGTPVTIQQ